MLVYSHVENKAIRISQMWKEHDASRTETDLMA